MTTAIDLGHTQRMTIEPHQDKQGVALVHVWADGMAHAYFEVTPKTAAEIVGKLMDAFAAQPGEKV